MIGTFRRTVNPLNMQKKKHNFGDGFNVKQIRVNHPEKIPTFSILKNPSKNDPQSPKIFIRFPWKKAEYEYISCHHP